MTAEQKLTRWEETGKIIPKQTILLIDLLGLETKEIGIFYGTSGNTKKRLRVKFWGEQRLCSVSTDDIIGLAVFSAAAIENLLKEVRGLAKESDGITSHEKRLDLVSRVQCLVNRHFPMTECLSTP